MTINLNDLSKKEILELEKQIQEYKKTANLLTLYKITFAIQFNPDKHKDDMLTCDGDPDPDIFADYLSDNLALQIERDFKLKFPEEVSGFKVEILPDSVMKDCFE